MDAKPASVCVFLLLLLAQNPSSSSAGLLSLRLNSHCCFVYNQRRPAKYLVRKLKLCVVVVDDVVVVVSRGGRRPEVLLHH